MNASVELGFRNWLDDLIETPVFTGSNDGEVPADALAIIISCPTLETVVVPLYRATVEVVVQGPASHEPIQDYRDVAAEVLDYLRAQNLGALADDLLAASDYYFGGLWVAQSQESVDDEYWRHTIELRVGLKREQDGTLWRNGLSAYEIAVVNGFGGTEAEWLESLAGPPGAAGSQGPAGATGPAGPNSVSTSTGSSITGLIKGDAGNLAAAVAGTDYAAASHSHAVSAVTGLQTALDAKAASNHSHGSITSDGKIGELSSLLVVTGANGQLTTSPTINGIATIHDVYIPDLQTVTFSTDQSLGEVLLGVDSAISGKAASSHSHAVSDVTGLQTALDGKAATSHSHAAGDITSGTLNDGRLSANVVLTNDSRLSDARTPTSHSHGNITNAGAIGTTANILPVTGASGVLAASNTTQQLLTAAPNNTVNVVQLGVTGGTTNADIVISPAGTGAFILGPPPDGTSTGGNKRGARAVDLRGSGGDGIASRVASGADSFRGPGASEASGSGSVAMGTSARATGNESFACGPNAAAQGASSLATNYQCSAEGRSSRAAGQRSAAWRNGMDAWATSRFSSIGDCQIVRTAAQVRTTNATPTDLLIGPDEVSTTTRVTVQSGRVMCYLVRVFGVKSDGSAVAEYWRRVRIKNVAGTTSLVGTVEVIGTDYEDNAATGVSITASDANDALIITVTGVAGETWRWIASIDGSELLYGT